MPPPINILGRKFGRLTTIAWRNGHWECRCDCGKVSSVLGYALRHGRIKSCGCYRADLNRSRTIHGLTGSPEYIVWNNMIRRCEDPKTDSYKYYGARGIKVCKRWHKFLNFIRDMGMRPFPSDQIDRRNNSGNYEPENCRWSDAITQGSNRRNNRVIDIDGEIATVSEWARRTGIDSRRIFSRIKRGWNPIRAVTTKPTKSRRKLTEGQILAAQEEIRQKLARMRNNKQDK